MDFKHKKKWLIGGTIGVVGLVSGIIAYAYTVNNSLAAYGYVVRSYGSYTLMGGDSINVLQSPWSALDQQKIHIALEQANVSDGKGDWGVMLADMQGADANNGYLLLAAPPELGGTSSNVKEWVERLGGNYNFVIHNLKAHNQLIKTFDQSTGQYYYYVPFAAVVNESGAIFGTKTISGQIGTYTDPSTGSKYSEYSYTYPIEPSAPPTINSLTVAVGGKVFSSNSKALSPRSEARVGENSIHQSTPLQPAQGFTGHFTSVGVARLEQMMGKENWVKMDGTIDPMKLDNGMKFTLTATTDNPYRSYIGQQYTLQLTVATRNGEYYPILFSMIPVKRGIKSLLVANFLSAIGWDQYFVKSGVSRSNIDRAYNQSGRYLFQCQSGAERGKTLVVNNFLQWENNIE